MPDGSTVARLPSIVRWIWDGNLSGAIGFRWQAGTAEFPPYVLGHIGFSVVPWKRGNGYAKQALNLMLHEGRLQDLIARTKPVNSSDAISRGKEVCARQRLAQPYLSDCEEAFVLVVDDSFRVFLRMSSPRCTITATLVVDRLAQGRERHGGSSASPSIVTIPFRARPAAARPSPCSIGSVRPAVGSG